MIGVMVVMMFALFMAGGPGGHMGTGLRHSAPEREMQYVEKPPESAPAPPPDQKADKEAR